MGKDLIDIFKFVGKVVIITGTTAAVDSIMNSYGALRPSNTVDAVFRKIGSGAIGFVIGDKAADIISEKAEQLYHVYEEARD